MRRSTPVLLFLLLLRPAEARAVSPASITASSATTSAGEIDDRLKAFWKAAEPQQRADVARKICLGSNGRLAGFLAGEASTRSSMEQRLAVVDAFAVCGDGAAVGGVLAEAGRDRSPRLRDHAARALLARGEETAAAPILVQLVKEGYKGVGKEFTLLKQPAAVETAASALRKAGEDPSLNDHDRINLILLGAVLDPDTLDDEAVALVSSEISRAGQDPSSALSSLLGLDFALRKHPASAALRVRLRRIFEQALASPEPGLAVQAGKSLKFLDSIERK